MASALQCPACGHKHRLSELTGDPIFSCEECGRLLKTPVEYRRPEPSAAPEAPGANGTSQVTRGGSATRDQTSVMRAPGPQSRETPAARPRRSSSRLPATLAVPVQILGWMLAIVLGGIIVRYVAKATGLLTGNSMIDLITGTGFGRYWRLFALVPFWALVSAGLMTLFVEGARRWQAQRSAPGHPAVKNAKKRTTIPPVKAPRPPSAKPSARQPSPRPEAAETRAPAAAAAPRARRIPRRDVS
jgi:hypothetical protein